MKNCRGKDSGSSSAQREGGWRGRDREGGVKNLRRAEMTGGTV